MGLDMYLSAKRYVGGSNHSDKEERAAYDGIIAALGKPNYRCDGSPHLSVKLNVAYWRKSNQIHAWFVANVQNGEDECRPHYVDCDKLKELVDLCEKVLTTKDTSLLPPQAGFFFGSTDIDQWYWNDLRETVDQIKPLLGSEWDGWEFEYCSSW